MKVCSRRVCRWRSRQKIVFICCLMLLIIYVVLCFHAGLPTVLDLETENIDFNLPYRFPVSQSWAWKDDIEYNFESEHASNNHGNNDNNNNSLIDVRAEETSQSLLQDHLGDYADQGRYIELEGLDDYIMWRDRFADPPTHSVIRKIKHCSRPIHNIVFLKTHYTGSDVITNIFNRFADLRNLRVGLPSDGLSTFHWPSRFQWKFLDMMIMGGALPNILCNHARYNADVMDAIMDRRTAFVTVLREPSALFESTFRNLEFAQVLDMESEHADPYSTFLDNPGKHVKRAIELKRFRDSLNLIKNSMSFDLGLRPAGYHKPEVVRDAILDLDDKFTLVMIFEYLDESLVLLKRRLCWDLDDILYLKFHYLDKEKNARRNTPKKEKEKVRKWNQADVLLYEYFNTTLWENIEREGDAFQENLRDFKGNQKAIEQDCLGNFTSAAPNNVVLNPQVSPFNRYLCEKLALDELQYLDYFRKKMENGRRGRNTFEDNAFKMNIENTSVSTDDLIK